MNTRTIVITLLTLGTVLMAWRLHRLSDKADAHHAELRAVLTKNQKDAADLVIQRQQDLARVELQMAMLECNVTEEDLTSIERNPCRLVCASLIDDSVRYTEHLSESICEALK